MVAVVRNVRSGSSHLKVRRRGRSPVGVATLSARLRHALGMELPRPLRGPWAAVWPSIHRRVTFARPTEDMERSELELLFRDIAVGDRAGVTRRLVASPELASRAMDTGAS